MTRLLSQNGLLNRYAREMEKHCLENNMPFTVLLVVGNAPGHPPYIGDLHPNIKEGNNIEELIPRGGSGGSD